MFDKKQKSCVKRIYLATEDGLFDRKDFHTVKRILFIHPLRRMTNLSIIGRPDHESKNEMVFETSYPLKAFGLLEDQSSSTRNNNLNIVWRIVETLRKVLRNVSEKAKAAVIYF